MINADILCPKCEKPMTFLTGHPPVDKMNRPMLDKLPVSLTFGCAPCNATVTLGAEELSVNPLYDLDLLLRFKIRNRHG